MDSLMSPDPETSHTPINQANGDGGPLYPAPIPLTCELIHPLICNLVSTPEPP